MAIRAVVFDIGGVLELTPKTGWEQKWETQLQLPPGDLHNRLRVAWLGGSIGTMPEEEVERRVGETLGLDAAQVVAFMDDLWAEYLGELNADLATYFAGLRPRYKTGILSNSFVGARHKEQDRYQFGDLCDLIIYSHEEGMRKPEWRFYELAWTRLGVQPHEMIFLDDVEACVEAALEVGIHGILFRDNAQAIAEIEACLQANI